ncbi:methyltransferase type 11, partial [bacterium]|nr:methyltransferase type 11 [bacterium]
MSSFNQSPGKSRGSALKTLLNVYWLRPETALWRAIDLMQLSHYEVTRPMLDLGCGDGIFSFIAMGGEFGPGFDMFRAVKDSREFFKGDDIYDYSTEELIKKDIVTPPRQKIDVGLDWKQNLLKKASELDLYELLVEHDANYPLPFADGQFDTIFSNI